MPFGFVRLTWVLLLFFIFQISLAQESDLTDAELEKQIAELEKQIQNELILEDAPWDFSSNIRFGGGYKENVTMSAFSDESSEFSIAGIDFFGVRLPMDDDGFELAIFGAFDDRRYFDAPSVEFEQSALLNTSLEKSLGNIWDIKTDVRYIYIDEMFDASLTEDDIGTVQVVGSQVSLEPTFRRNFIGNIWVELKPEISRQYFADPLDDYLEKGGRVSAGIDYGFRSKFSIYKAKVRRAYDTRSQRDEVGFYVPDSDLIYDRPERGLDWIHYLNSDRSVRMRTRFSIMENEDNGSGYFGFRRERLLHNWRFQFSKFSFSATLRKALYNYDFQRSADFKSLRERTDRSVEVSLNYVYSTNLSIKLEFDQEKIQSNVPQDEYRYRIYSIGLDWEF
tara:strand:+ start:101 stop:1279 length:1179 start_codon:yes stop_codon:yes gene_type:complete